MGTPRNAVSRRLALIAAGRAPACLPLAGARLATTTRSLLTLAVLAFAGVAPAVASAATPVDGMFSITPARRYVVATPPVELAASTVANGTAAPLEVEAVPVLLRQTPSGAFAFSQRPQALDQARRILAVSPRRFLLAPRASRLVALRWRRLPPHARAANLGVVFEAVPPRGAGAVQVVERLLSVDLLRVPGHYRVAGAISRVHLDEAGGTLSCAISVHNGGNVFAAPRGIELSVYDARGKRVLRRAVRPDVVLPGEQRAFAVSLPRSLPTGSYRAVAELRFGHERSRRSVSFRLARGGRLPAADVRLGQLDAYGSAGGSARVSIVARNTGTLAGHADVELALYRLGDGSSAPLARATIRSGALRPGGRARLRGTLGSLRAGAYRLLATYRGAAGTPETLTADFSAVAAPGALARIATFSREHALAIPAVLLAIVALLLGLVLVRARSGGREPTVTR